jgi:predicted DNA-binding transcriptional regulator AlpA
MNTTATTSPIQTEALSAPDAARLIGVSPAHFYQMAKSGKLGPMPVRFGRTTRWIRRELVAWLDAGAPPRHRWVEMRKRVLGLG